MFRKIILMCVSVAALIGAAQAQTQLPSKGDIRVDVSNGLFGLDNWYVIPPKDGSLGFPMYGLDLRPGATPGAVAPQSRKFGSSIVCGTTNNSTCDVVFPATSPGFDGKYTSLTDVPTSFAPASHPSTLISDMTSTGRALVQASDASAVRALLGVQSASDAAASFYPLSGNPAGYLTSSVAASTYLTPGAAAGIYATSASVASALTVKADNSALTAGLATKFTTPTCPTTQYLRGDGSCATFPAIPTVPVINRAVVATATDGTYTWTFPTACAAGQTPAVSVTPQNNTAAEVINHKVTAVSNTSMSISLSRAILTLTSIPLLSNITLPIVQTTPGAQTVHLIAICP